MPSQSLATAAPGTADNDLPAHINIKLSEWFAVCGVREFSLDISRDELDVTTLPCGDSGTGCGKELACIPSTQAGYATATGTMSVYFTCDQDNIANRLLGSSLLKSPGWSDRALVRLHQDDSGEIDNDTSLYIEAESSICSACPSRSTPTIRPPASCSASPSDQRLRPATA